jgi:hypothetical protein
MADFVDFFQSCQVFEEVKGPQERPSEDLLK